MYLQTRKRLLLIGAHEEEIEKACAAGLAVVCIQKKECINDRQIAAADQLFCFDYEDSEVLLPLARGIHAAYPADFVLSLTETGLVPAALVTEALGLPGNPVATVRLLRDKWAMREWLNAAGLSPVAARRGETADDIKAFLHDVCRPAIVKPVDGVGSASIFQVQSAADVDRVWQRMQAVQLRGFLMEEYLDGPEISVETFTFNGRHLVLALTATTTTADFIESGHAIPAQLDPAMEGAVLALVADFLSLIGLREGPAHTELRLTPDGPRIVESHNRIGGDRIGRLVELVYGVDMEALACTYPLGRAAALDVRPSARGGAAIRYLAATAGRVRSVEGVDEVATQEEIDEIEVTVKPGDDVKIVTQSSDRVGYLITYAADVHTAVSTAERLVRDVCICTE